MKKAGISACAVGAAVNFLLFLTKMYIGISSGSLSIYCDGINNLGDVLTCSAALAGFFFIAKLNDEGKGRRAESLLSFVINLIICAAGVYFAYSGIERLLYPLPVSFSVKYAVIISAAVIVKILLAVIFIALNKKAPSNVLRALILDSMLDSAVGLVTLVSLFISIKINYAADGIFALIIGITITAFAVKSVIRESKFIINNR